MPISIQEFDDGRTVTSGTFEEFAEHALGQLQESPEDEVLKMNLALALYNSGKREEAAVMARQICPDGSQEVRSPSAEMRALMVRSRTLIESRVSEYAGPEGARLMLQYWDNALGDFDQSED